MQHECKGAYTRCCIVVNLNSKQVSQVESSGRYASGSRLALGRMHGESQRTTRGPTYLVRKCVARFEFENGRRNWDVVGLWQHVPCAWVCVAID